jgi:hypothetical protein
MSTHDDQKPLRRPKPAGPVGIDQRPGEEVVQVNDAYDGGGPPPEEPTKDEQHPTGG